MFMQFCECVRQWAKFVSCLSELSRLPVVLFVRIIPTACCPWGEKVCTRLSYLSRELCLLTVVLSFFQILEVESSVMVQGSYVFCLLAVSLLSVHVDSAGLLLLQSQCFCCGGGGSGWLVVCVCVCVCVCTRL